MSKINVRYIVNDVDGAIPFYTEMLGFKLDMHPAPGFASLSRGDLQLLLNRPGAGGAGQAMPDGQRPAPGGWNRIPTAIPFQTLAGRVQTRGRLPRRRQAALLRRRRCRRPSRASGPASVMERIVIGENIVVTVVKIAGNGFHDGPPVVCRSRWTISRPHTSHDHGS